MILHNVPWEEYIVNGIVIHVKREDLSCPPPGPSFSKMRGVESYLSKLPADTPVGVLDTVHSKAGWGVSYICNKLGLTCYNFYPVYKSEGSIESHGLRLNQRKAKRFGAIMVPLKAGRSAILYHQSRKKLASMTKRTGLMLPNALKLEETVDATANEVIDYTPSRLFAGTWVVSISSGTIAAGVVMGLREYNDDVCVIAHMGYSRSERQARKYITSMAGYNPHDLVLVDEKYNYKDKVDYPCPFPCNPWYDLKAWKWLLAHAHDLEQSIIFWNIGA